MKPPAAETVELLAARAVCSSQLKLVSVTQSIQDRNMPNSQEGHVIKDIVSYLDSFQSCSFSHVGR